MAARFHTGTSGIDGDFVVIPDAAAIQNVFDGGGTLSVWVYADSYGMLSFGRIADKDGASVHGWKLFVDNFSGSPNRFGFVQQFSGAEGDWTTPNNSLPLGEWLHLVVRYNADSTTNNPVFSVNGMTVATTEQTTPTGTRDDDSGARLLLGQVFAYTRAFDGRIADFHLFTRTISDAEVLTMYNARGRSRIITSLAGHWPLSPHREARGIATPWRDDTEVAVASASSIVVPVAAHVAGNLLTMAIGAGSSGGTATTITTPTNWTQRVHLALPATATTPRLAVYSKVAGTPVAEPVSYTVSADQTSPMQGEIKAYSNVATTPTDVSTNTGTSATPSSPSVTPAVNTLIQRYALVDSDTNEPGMRGNFFPSDVRGKVIISSSGGGSNGCVLGTGEESRDGAASGTRDWAPVASDQWGTATLSWAAGDGNEGLPAKDFSPAQGHGESWHRLIGAEDTLRAGGW